MKSIDTERCSERFRKCDRFSGSAFYLRIVQRLRFFSLIFFIHLSPASIAAETAEDQLKHYNEQLRARFSRIRGTVKDMYELMLIQTEACDRVTESDAPVWNKLTGDRVNQVFKNNIIEVHYFHRISQRAISIDTINSDQKLSYQFRKFEAKDLSDIIPITIFRPNVGHKVPVALYMHGGPKSLIEPSTVSPIFAALSGMGFAIVAPNYRGSSWSDEFAKLLEGNVAQYSLEDMQATIAYAKTLDFYDDKKIFLSGISYGTYLNSINLDKIAHELSGAFLHTGLFHNSSPSPFDVIPKMSLDLPILLVGGMKDYLPQWTLKYIRAFQDINPKFKFYLVENGGHHLNSTPRQSIAAYALKNDFSSTDIKDVIDHTATRYNAPELIDYCHHFVEFLDEIVNGPLPAAPADSSPSIGNLLTIPHPQSKEIIDKAMLAQTIKGRNKENLAATFGPAAMEKERGFRNSDYTFSLAHLKIILGDKFVDFNLESNVEEFLKMYDLEKPKIFAEYEKAYPPNEEDQKDRDRIIAESTTDNKELIELILEILKKERSYDSHYVAYHGADGSIGFIYDVYSSLRRLMLIQARASNDFASYVNRIRLLDDAFEKILSAEDLINKMRKLAPHYIDSLFNNIPGYKDVGISAQLFLFGSYKYWFNSTFFRYFRENKVASSISITELLKAFFTNIGIVNPAILQKIVNNYAAIYNDYSQSKNGRLLQIFISEKIIDEVLYVSETGGWPLDLQIDKNHDTTHAPSKIMPAVKDPEAFETMLMENRSQFKHQDGADRSEFIESQAGLHYIDSVEARICLKPLYMDDPKKIQIINYSLHSQPPEYANALEAKTAEHLALWLNGSHKLGLAMTHSEPPLLRLQNYVDTHFKNGPSKRKAFTLYDLLSAGQWSSAEAYMKEHRHEEQEWIAKDGEPLHQLLLDHKFIAAQWMLEHGESVNRKNENGVPIFYKTLLEGSAETARWLIKHKIALNEKMSNGSYILLEIIENQQLEIAHILLECEAVDIDLTDSYDGTALIRAASGGHLSIVDKLLERKRRENLPGILRYLNHRNKRGNSALALSCDRAHEEVSLVLLSAGADITHFNELKSTPLHSAVSSGNERVVNEIVRIKKQHDPDNFLAYINHQNEDQNSALMLACIEENLIIVHKLIKNGADYTQQNISKDTALIFAAKSGNEGIVRELLKRKRNDDPEHLASYVNHLNDDGLSALTVAIENKHSAAALALLEAGADLGWILEIDGSSPLIRASFLGLNSVVEAIIKVKEQGPRDEYLACLNFQNNNGISALETALACKYQDVALTLIAAGAKIDAKDKRNNTALIQASLVGFTRVVEAIIERKKKEDPDGLLEYLDYQNDSGIGAGIFSAIMNRPDVFLLLAKAGLTLDVLDPHKETFLIWSIKNNYLEIFDLILTTMKKNGHENFISFLNKKHKFQATALREAVFSNHANAQTMAIRLINEGADITSLTSKGDTVLIAASSKNYVEIVEAVLERSRQDNPVNFVSYLNHKNGRGLSALHIAIDSGHVQVIAILEKYGAKLDLTTGFYDVPLFYVDVTSVDGVKLENNETY